MLTSSSRGRRSAQNLFTLPVGSGAIFREAVDALFSAGVREFVGALHPPKQPSPRTVVV